MFIRFNATRRALVKKGFLPQQELSVAPRQDWEGESFPLSFPTGSADDMSWTPRLSRGWFPQDLVGSPHAVLRVCLELAVGQGAAS